MRFKSRQFILILTPLFRRNSVISFKIKGVDAPIAPSSRGVGIWKNDLSVDDIAKRRHELLRNDD